MDYYNTNHATEDANERQRQAEGFREEKGLRNLSSFEKTCVVIIALAIVGFVVKVFVLGHGVTDFGL